MRDNQWLTPPLRTHGYASAAHEAALLADSVGLALAARNTLWRVSSKG
jgi:hypothetical protein